MPMLIDEPELRFTRNLFEEASRRPASENPHAQLGAWTVFYGFVRTFEQNFIWPVEKPNATVMQIYRAGLTCVLGMGENLLTLGFSSDETAAIEAIVRSLRDKLVIEFSEATAEQSEKLLASIFGGGICAG